jgi:hypothetical protein
VAAGVLQATTEPPSEAARASASAIRLIMTEGFLHCEGRRPVRCLAWPGVDHGDRQ